MRRIKDDSFDLNEEATMSTVQPSTITRGHDPVTKRYYRGMLRYVIVKLTGNFNLI
jgi:hypothetical protein